MCGIAGILSFDGRRIDPDRLLGMAAAIRHRGPDGYGFVCDDWMGLSHVRLSIIDPAHGAQPMSNEDETIWISYNGEIYNAPELRRVLKSRGHRFRGTCDTEVVIHAFEEWGESMLERFNGQFAFVLTDTRKRTALLARDRVGIRPLFYARTGETWIIGSEVKAILEAGLVEAAPDLRGIDQIFTFWATRGPRTAFAGISSLPPGHWATISSNGMTIGKWFEPRYDEQEREYAGTLGVLTDLMRESVELRLRSDVPVGTYLSGGLDSSAISSVASRVSPYRLSSFSVNFDDPELDERGFQSEVATLLQTDHFAARASDLEITNSFPEIVWHAETPLLRTAPAGLYLLARTVRDHGLKVVLTGEGADEIFLGYDIFKEAMLRWFCLRQPDSAIRPLLFSRLYPYLPNRKRSGEFWSRFFLEDRDLADPLFSHLPRFRLAGQIKHLYSADMRAELQGYDALDELRGELPARFSGWPLLNRAAYLETAMLLPNYLLSSQGDRMSMAFGVETRFPYLDPDVVRFGCNLPTRSKLRGLDEKSILKRWAADLIPQSVVKRPKQPYRAPDAPGFIGPTAPAYVADVTDHSAIRDAGIFDNRAVGALLKRARSKSALSVRASQAVVGLLSTQLWFARFRSAQPTAPELKPNGADVAVFGSTPITTSNTERSHG